MATTNNFSLRYPTDSDLVDITDDFNNLATDVDTVLNTTFLPLAGGTVTGVLSGTNATDSSSSTTGAWKTAGGLGVAKKLYVGETIVATSTVSASGLAGSLLSSANPLINGSAAPGSSAIPSRQDHVHPTDTTRAPLAGPTFTGTVTLPTLVGSDTTDASSSTTGAFKTAGGMGVAKKLYVGDTIVTAAATTSIPSLRIPHGAAPSSPTNGDVWTTTAGIYVRINGSTVGPLGSGTGAGTWGSITGTLSAQTDLNTALGDKAPLASPTFTGTVTLPVLVGSDATDSSSSTTGAFKTAGGMGVAKKLYVGDNLNVTGTITASSTVSASGLAGSLLSSANPIIDGTAAPGTSAIPSRQDHVHPTDTSRAALSGPTFTGVPAAPTASVDTNTTQIATTAFVVGQATSSTPVIASGAGAVGTSLRYARGDHVHPPTAIALAVGAGIPGGTPAGTIIVRY